MCIAKKKKSLFSLSISSNEKIMSKTRWSISYRSDRNFSYRLRDRYKNTLESYCSKFQSIIRRFRTYQRISGVPTQKRKPASKRTRRKKKSTKEKKKKLCPKSNCFFHGNGLGPVHRSTGLGMAILPRPAPTRPDP